MAINYIILKRFLTLKMCINSVNHCMIDLSCLIFCHIHIKDATFLKASEKINSNLYGECFLIFSCPSLFMKFPYVSLSCDSSDIDSVLRANHTSHIF